MSVNDGRDKTKRYTGGSDLIAVGLSAANHIAASGDPSATGGWVVLGYMEGGEHGFSRDSEEVKSEADVLVGVRTSRDEYEIVNTSMQGDDALFNILEWLEDPDNASLVRYSLPTQESTENQWIFLYSATVRKEDRRVSTSRDADRSVPFTIVGSEDGSGNIKKIITLPSNQADAQWASYAAFKDTAFP